MTTKIQELAEQSGWSQGKSWDDCMTCSTFDLEQFAQRIVQECANTAMRKLVIDRLAELMESHQDGIPVYHECLQEEYITDPEILQDMSDQELLDCLEATLGDQG